MIIMAITSLSLSQFLKDLTLQSRAIFTNVCQLLTPIIIISFAGIMQVILNLILREHGTAVPGTASLSIPMDISRSLACNATNFTRNPEILLVTGTEDGQAPYNITDCHDNFANFLDDFPGLIQLANDISELKEIIQNWTLFTYARPQDLLFNLPMFYISK